MSNRYTFKPGDYIKFMNPLTADRGADQHYECPICGLKVRSTWGHADNHWQGHASGKGSEPCSHCKGKGWSIIGLDEVECCPSCHGSGKAEEAQ